MMRSLFAGVSALKNHQVRMDVIGNNIANVNTVGFKASTVTFKEQLSQTLRGAGAPQGGRGGTNPQQIGLGVDVGAITNIHTPGNLQSTGVESDVAIEGNGYFIVSDGTESLYTRSGAFDFGPDGSLVSLTSGLKVMGYMARNGQVDARNELVPIRIPLNTTLPPVATTEATIVGNLDAKLSGTMKLTNNPVTLADAAGDPVQASIVLNPTGGFNEWNWRIESVDGTVSQAGGRIYRDASGAWTTTEDGEINFSGEAFDVTVVTSPSGEPQFVWTNQASGHSEITAGEFTEPEQAETSLRVFDSRGTQHDLFFSFTKVGDNGWTWVARDPSGIDRGTGSLQYDMAGSLVSQTGIISWTPPGAEPLEITPDFSGVTQYAEATDVSKALQDGFPSGTLSTISIDTAGYIHGSFSNGLSETLAQIALADFSNPAGLIKSSGSLFKVSSNSGEPDIGVAGTGSRGTVSPGSLEMSNVDLSQEFTNMIVTQRGYQANSRIITTSDEMLQELVNLKR